MKQIIKSIGGLAALAAITAGCAGIEQKSQPLARESIGNSGYNNKLAEICNYFKLPVVSDEKELLSVLQKKYGKDVEGWSCYRGNCILLRAGE